MTGLFYKFNDKLERCAFREEAVALACLAQIGNAIDQGCASYSERAAAMLSQLGVPSHSNPLLMGQGSLEAAQLPTPVWGFRHCMAVVYTGCRLEIKGQK